MSNVLAGKSRWEMSEFRKQEVAYYEAQSIKQACAFCKWKFEGTVLEGREAAQKHREEKHPETFNIPRRRRRSPKTLTTFRQTAMDNESISEIETERKKRAYLNGVDLNSQT